MNRNEFLAQAVHDDEAFNRAVHGSYGKPYHHEDGDEHRHDGVTDIHEGGDQPHTHTLPSERRPG